MANSNNGDADFRKMTLIDARKSMHDELEKLLATAAPEARDVSYIFYKFYFQIPWKVNYSLL